MRILVRGGVQCPTYVVYSKRAGVIPYLLSLARVANSWIWKRRFLHDLLTRTHTHFWTCKTPFNSSALRIKERHTKNADNWKKMPTTRCFAKLSFGLSGKLSLRRVAKTTAFKSHFHFPGTVTFCHSLSIHRLSLAFCLTDVQKSHLFQQIIHYCGHQMWGFSVFA